MMLLTKSINTKYIVNTIYFILSLTILIACTKLYIPLKPVPITMGTVGVMLVGCLYSTRIGLTSVFAYIMLGLIGVPVFSGNAVGLAVLLGPTGGYILGYVFCVYIMSQLKAKIGLDNIKSIVFICIVGTIVIFIFGVSWLAVYLHSLKQAIYTGFLPFIIPGIAKVAVLAGFLRIFGILKLKYAK